MGYHFMVMIYEKRTSFNCIDHMLDFNDANIKNIKHKISQIKEFNIKSHKKAMPMISTPQNILKKTVFPTKSLVLSKSNSNYKEFIETLKIPPLSDKKLIKNQENQCFFTLVYDEVVDFLSNKDNMAINNAETNIKRHLFTEEDDDLLAVDRLLSPKMLSPESSMLKKQDIKLLRSIKIKTKERRITHSRSISPTSVFLIYLEIFH